MNYPLVNAFLILLDNYKSRISMQQYKTLRGQAIKGYVLEAQKGLGRLLRN